MRILLALLFVFTLASCDDKIYTVKFQDNSIHQCILYSGRDHVDMKCSDGYYGHVTNFRLIAVQPAEK